MRLILAATMLMISSVPAIAADKAPPPPEPTQQPDWAQVRVAAEKMLTSGLFDPQSAQIDWNGGWSWGHTKIIGFFSKRDWGWLGCANLNAKNRMGGYVGATPMWVLLKTNGEMTTGPLSDVTSECDDGSARPALQPAFMTAPTGSSAPSLADELAKLADLKSKGILTDDEFAAQKAKLLSR